MANVVCVRCGMRGDSKCPFCRNVRADERRRHDHHLEIGMVDTILSHRLKIFEDRVEIRLYPRRDGSGKPTGEHESAADVLKLVVSLIGEAVGDDMTLEQVCAVVGCAHEWDFAPRNYSDIGCGHRAAPDPECQSHAASARDFRDAGFDPDELCDCGDLMKAHYDNLECAACPCMLYTPAWLRLLPNKEMLVVMSDARRYCLHGPDTITSKYPPDADDRQAATIVGGLIELIVQEMRKERRGKE